MLCFYPIPYINVIWYFLPFSEILKWSPKANCWPVNSFDSFLSALRRHRVFHLNCLPVNKVSTVSHEHSDVMIVKLKKFNYWNICINYWILPFFFNLSDNKTVVSYGILEQSNSCPSVSGIVFLTVAWSLWPWATV